MSNYGRNYPSEAAIRYQQSLVNRNQKPAAPAIALPAIQAERRMDSLRLHIIEELV